MAKRNTLRVVSPDETPPAPSPPPAPLTLTKAAEAGNTLAMLMAMRERIAKAVESEATPPRDLAALTKRLVEVQHEIEVLTTREGEKGQAGPDAVGDEAFDPQAI